MKILVPTLGESVTEATVAKWLKNKGDSVSKDEVLVELETDKATLEVYAQSNGVLSEIYIGLITDSVFIFFIIFPLFFFYQYNHRHHLISMMNLFG